MAKKKAVGSLKNGRDSKSKRLGLKKHTGNIVNKGNIIVRQIGMKYKEGINTKKGKDFTLYSIKNGIVCFKKKKINVINYNLLYL
ncbi:50S ribosomal protein L27 [Candidatus Vidania fulgoroideorum]